MTPLRVMVVDDSPLIRQIVVDMLRREDDIDVVGYAHDGEEALHRMAELSPDVVTLDMDMPRLDGLGCLKEMMATRPTPAVMIATATARGIEATVDALAMGAADFVLKPESGSLSTLRGIRGELVEKVRRASFAKVSGPLAPAANGISEGESDRLVLLSGGTGSLRSLESIFEGLPPRFRTPIVISLPVPCSFIAPLAQRLTDLGGIPVIEARPGDRPEAGYAILGSGLTFSEGGYLHLGNGHAYEDADRFFRTAALAYGDRCIAALLSGLGCDGADGAMVVRRACGSVFVESEETCTHFEMPEAALANGAVNYSIRIEALGEAIANAATI